MKARATTDRRAVVQMALGLGADAAKLAAMRANRVHGDFTEKALAAFHLHALTHRQFTAEDVRLAYADRVPKAPDNRAWGCVARMAVRKGYCQPAGVTHARSPHCHGTWIAAYESLVYGATQ